MCTSTINDAIVSQDAEQQFKKTKKSESFEKLIELVRNDSNSYDVSTGPHSEKCLPDLD